MSYANCKEMHVFFLLSFPLHACQLVELLDKELVK